MPTGYTILEHPADLGLEATGASLAEAFSRAAEGLTSIVVDPSGIGTSLQRTVLLHADDVQQLLVRWLDEILFLYDSGGFLCGRADVTFCSHTDLRAELIGELLIPAKHASRLDVKAITYHQILVQERPGDVTLRVFLDI